MEIDDGEALELTYDLVATTMQSHDIRYLLSRFMHKVVGILGAEAALVRTAKSGELELVDSVGFQQNSPLIDARISLGKFRQQEVPERILVGTRVDSFSADLLSNQSPKSGKSDRQQLISVPLKFKNSIYGCYQFLLPTEEPLEKNSLILLETVGKHVGFLVEQARMDSDSARLLLVEERSRMANEMHDSLAQTLASLRMQVRVMDETFEIKIRNHKDESVNVIVKENMYRWHNWKILSNTGKYEKIDAHTVHFPVTIKKDGESIVRYKVRYTW